MNKKDCEYTRIICDFSVEYKKRTAPDILRDKTLLESYEQKVCAFLVKCL
ncbi:Predicted protein [Listeria monocytogenes]|nr:Predicted protein [Listeria monocytogenes QOC2]CDK43225.1 Predicted protein [Listeria monocytogenes QOC1]CDM17400.1 Predicted protein [Listeria monocytogenes R479a]CDN70605.1 Predicted protein [Listeria monocytogenes 4423]CUK33584.1 Predicted protein [Listeria monocytogenes]